MARQTPVRPCASRRRTSPRSSPRSRGAKGRPQGARHGGPRPQPVHRQELAGRQREDAPIPRPRESTMPCPKASSRSISAGLGGPPERRAFAWRSGAYLGGPQVGFHGGCGLEEVVVPLAWIERDGLHADEPTWWYGRGALAKPSVELRPVAPPIVTPLPSDEIPPKPKAQLSLFNPAEKAGSCRFRRRCSNDSAPMRSRSSSSYARTAPRAPASLRAVEQEPRPSQRSDAGLRRTLHADGHVLFTTRCFRAVRRCTATKRRRGADGRRLRSLAAIVNALRSGLVPNEGLEHFATGLDPLVRR